MSKICFTFVVEHKNDINMEDNEPPWTESEINEFKYDSKNHTEWETMEKKNDEEWSKEEMKDFNK